jgi:hypothetical protein
VVEVVVKEQGHLHQLVDQVGAVHLTITHLIRGLVHQGRQDRAMAVVERVIFIMKAEVVERERQVAPEIMPHLVVREGLDNTLQYQALILLMRVVVVVILNLLPDMLLVEWEVVDTEVSGLLILGIPNQLAQ